ncbi:MAG: hypothetical protein R3212_08835, partial [Xanthomonadales bacterium]|nr:hypothetical protein [Xanthomonadales bacterium]
MSSIHTDRKVRGRFLVLVILWFLPAIGCGQAQDSTPASGYQALLELFEEWRRFEVPPDLEGAPDYTAETTAARHQALKR